MRNLLLFIGLALLATAAPLPAVEGTWSVLGPDGGSVYDLAFQPRSSQILYASVPGGVFKSRDGGATWAWSGSGLEPRSQTFNLAFDPVQTDTVYVAQAGGIFKSVNGGQSWRNAGRPTAYGVAVHPRFSGRVFAATEHGLFRSLAGGPPWTRLTQGLPASYRATLVVFDPNSERRLYASIQNTVTNGGGLFRSTDGGATWRPLHGGPLENRRIYSLAIDPRSPATLYAGTDSAVYKSTDGGTTWRPTGLGAASVPGIVWTLKAHPRLGVYAGTTTGLFRSQDGGATWTRPSQGLPAGESVFAFVFSPSLARTVYAGVATFLERGGVFKSVNAGSSWAFSSRGLSGLFVESIAVDRENPDRLWVIANTVPFRSTDRGQTWTRVRPDPEAGDARAKRVAVDPFDGSNVYIMLPDGTLRRTRDGGQTWEIAGDPKVAPFGNATLVFDPRSPGTLYAAGIGIAKSTDGGTTWVPLPGEPSDMVFFDLAISPSSPSTLYGTGGGGTGGPRVVRTTDGGATWSRIQQGLPSNLLELVVDPLISTAAYGFFEGLVYKTTDGGATWSVFSDAFRDRSILPLEISPSGLLYGGAWFDNVYQIREGEGTW